MPRRAAPSQISGTIWLDSSFGTAHPATERLAQKEGFRYLLKGKDLRRAALCSRWACHKRWEAQPIRNRLAERFWFYSVFAIYSNGSGFSPVIATPQTALPPQTC